MFKIYKNARCAFKGFEREIKKVNLLAETNRRYEQFKTFALVDTSIINNISVSVINKHIVILKVVYDDVTYFVSYVYKDKSVAVTNLPN